MTTSLYRFYDDHGALLYIGISNRLGRRLHEHAKTKPWYPQIASATVVHYPTRRAAEQAEQSAIRNERPAHNITHNPAPGTGLTPAATGRLGHVATSLRCDRYDPHYTRELATAQAEWYAELGARRVHLTQCRTHGGGWGVLYLTSPTFDQDPMHELDVACHDLAAYPLSALLPGFHPRHPSAPNGRNGDTTTREGANL